MSWDFAIYGSLRFEDTNEAAKWLDCRILSNQYEETFPPFTDPLRWSKKEIYTVQDFFDRWDDLFQLETNPLDFKIYSQDNQYDFRGYLDKDVVTDLGHEIAGAFRVASECRCEGELFFIGVANTIAFKVTVGSGISTIWELEEDLEDSEMVFEVMKWAEKIIRSRIKKGGGKT